MSDNHKIDTGYSKIPDKALENIAQIKLSATQSRLLMIIWRYTYGFNRKQHYMSLTFLGNATGCFPRNIQKELKKLQERKIINQVVQGKKRYLSFNEKYHEWLDIEGMIDIFGTTDVIETNNFESDIQQNKQSNYVEIDVVQLDDVIIDVVGIDKGNYVKTDVVQTDIVETDVVEVDKVEIDKCEDNQPNYVKTDVVQTDIVEIDVRRNRQGDYVGIDKVNYVGIDNQDKHKNKSKDIARFFENVWMHIPNKKGKSRVSNAQKKKLYEHVGEEKLICAINKYCQEVQGREEKYIMHGSTFLNGSYEDYLPVEVNLVGVKPTGKIVYMD